MTESQIIFLNYEIQKALEAESKGAVALPAINWIDLLSKLIPILIQVLKPAPAPTPPTTSLTS